jgi:hypothetical protein
VSEECGVHNSSLVNNMRLLTLPVICSVSFYIPGIQMKQALGIIKAGEDQVHLMNMGDFWNRIEYFIYIP